MRPVQHIYLIPGFFGFVNFGRLVYFAHVREFLEHVLDRHGVRAEIHRIRIPPTASLRTRAAHLHRAIVDTAPPDAPLHLVGHSTGGLDARLFLTEGASLPGSPEVDGAASRVRTAISLCTPHHGTPIAAFFTGLMGEQLLRLLSVLTVAVLREGRLPTSMLARIAAALARVQLPGGKADVIFDHLHRELIGHLPGEDQEQFNTFFADVSKDQSLMPQLTPAGLDLLNGSAADRPGVRYVSVVARAARPSLRSQWRLGASTYPQASYVLFRWLHQRVAQTSAVDAPRVSPDQRVALRAFLGELPSLGDNDGIVPTLSQVWGEVIHGVEGDHYDVIGHFADERHVPPHHDWLATGSDFGRRQFETLWSKVARVIAEAA